MARSAKHVGIRTMSTGFVPFFVHIEQLDGEDAPRPLPLLHGFSRDAEYLVIALYNPSETSDSYLVMPNDWRELWFISTRHVRFSRLKE